MFSGKISCCAALLSLLQIVFKKTTLEHRFYLCRKNNIQGVPRNMTIGRRLETRLWYLNLFVTFSLLSTLTCMILEPIIT